MQNSVKVNESQLFHQVIVIRVTHQLGGTTLRRSPA